VTEFRYHLLDTNERVIFSNIRPKERELIDTVNLPSILLLEGKLRGGVLLSKSGTVFGFSSDLDYLRSTKKFRTTLEVILNSIDFVLDAVRTHSETTNASTRRLIHNLTSLNAHNIQEIYSLVPQEQLASKTNGHVDEVQKIVSESPRDVALALLAIAKTNLSMKTEFSVFKNLFNAQPSLQRKRHVIHKVLMNVLYLFFPDFTDKDVHISVTESTVSAWFDYESIHVALYHLLDNASKYVKPRSNIDISIEERDQCVALSFKMRSLRILKEEIPKLFDEGFSGGLAEKTGKSGSGIGTSLIKKILELNNGAVVVNIHPETVETLMGIDYQDNVFEILLPRKAESAWAL
jgi:signal transduction histidine kinase